MTLFVLHGLHRIFSRPGFARWVPCSRGGLLRPRARDSGLPLVSGSSWSCAYVPGEVVTCRSILVLRKFMNRHASMTNVDVVAVLRYHRVFLGCNLRLRFNDAKDQRFETSPRVPSLNLFRVRAYLGKAAGCLLVTYLLQTHVIKQTRRFALSNSGGRVGRGKVIMLTTRCGAEKQLASLLSACILWHVSDGVAC